MSSFSKSSSYSSPYRSISCIFSCAPQVVYLSQGYPVGNTHFVTISCRFSRPLTLGNTHFVTESRRFSRPLTLSNTLVTESCSFSRPRPHYPSPAQTLASQRLGLQSALPTPARSHLKFLIEKLMPHLYTINQKICICLQGY